MKIYIVSKIDICDYDLTTIKLGAFTEKKEAEKLWDKECNKVIDEWKNNFGEDRVKQDGKCKTDTLAIYSKDKKNGAFQIYQDNSCAENACYVSIDEYEL